MVDEIIRSRVRDRQLDECDLTLHELAEIKDSFCTTLRSMLHNRISYPKETSEEDDQKKEERRSQGKARKEEQKKEEQKKGGPEKSEEQQVASSNPV